MRYEVIVEDKQAQQALEGFLAQHPEVKAAPIGREPWETDAFIEDLVRIANHAKAHPETLVTVEEAFEFARKHAEGHAGKAD